MEPRAEYGSLCMLKRKGFRRPCAHIRFVFQNRPCPLQAGILFCSFAKLQNPLKLSGRAASWLSRLGKHAGCVFGRLPAGTFGNTVALKALLQRQCILPADAYAAGKFFLLFILTRCQRWRKIYLLTQCQNGRKASAYPSAQRLCLPRQRRADEMKG